MTLAPARRENAPPCATGGTDALRTLWAGCLPAGLFRSSDKGASWQRVNRPPPVAALAWAH